MDLVVDGVRIRFYLAGPDDGDPVLLHHGYASDYQLNWVGSRWQDALLRTGRLVIGLDARGHGASDKPHDPAAYGTGRMAADVLALLDHLGIERTDFIGYSMGARVGLHLAVSDRERLHRGVLGGLGMSTPQMAEAIAARMEGGPPGDAVVETFHRFAGARPHNDLRALAAVMRAPNPPWSERELSSITTPLLFVGGSADPIAPDSRAVAALLPGSRYEEVAGRDHATLVPARAFKDAAIAFLDGA